MRASWLKALALLAVCSTLATFQAAAAESLSGQQRAEAAGAGLVGSRAPNMVLKTIDGQEIDLGRLYGKKAIYLKFWATWCTPCREQMPHFEHTYETAGPDLAVIAINVGFNDSLEEVQTFRRRLGITMPIVIDDGRLGRAFNLRVTPQHVIIGRDGRIEYVGQVVSPRLEAALVQARMSEPTKPTAAGSSIPQDLKRYGVGDRMPNLTAKTLDGSLFHIRDSSSHRPTVLVFMSPWCESYLATTRPTLATNCRQVREQVDGLAERDTRFRWIAVASGLWATEDDVREYADKHKTHIPFALDESGAWFRSFRVMSVPTLLIANARGQIVREIEGFEADLPTALDTAAKN